MAKKSITQATYATDNIQNQPDQVVGQATSLKLSFDQTGIDAKTYTNTTLIPELGNEDAGNSGSNTIGHNSASITADNVGDALEENRLQIDQNETDIATNTANIALKANDNAVVKLTGDQSIDGVKTFTSSPKVPETPITDEDAASKKYVDDQAPLTIPDNSITNAKLGTDIKVGSLATLTTTVKTDVVSAINEIDSEIGDLSTLTTTDKSSVVNAINEVNAGLDPKPYLRSRSIANQSILNSTNTDVLFDEASADDNFDMLGVDDKTVTIPEDGIYIISTGIWWAGAVSGYRQIQIRVNNISKRIVRQITTGGDVYQEALCVLRLSQNDVILIKGLQNSGGALNINSSNDFSAVIEVAKVGD